MPRPRHAVLAALVVVSLLALPTVPAAAHQRAVGPGRTAAAGSFHPIVGQLDGRTGPELFADSFVFDYVGPALSPTGDCRHLGRHDRVVWLSNDPTTCHLRAGETAVALVGAGCSDVEEAPFFAVGPAAQRACARDNNAAVTSLTLAVDAGAPIELHLPAFAVHPPQRHIVIPADNPAGFPAGPATFTSDGWAAALRLESSGTHTVHVVAIFAGVDTPIEETLTVLVAPERR